MPETPVNTLKDQVSQMKIQFERVKEEMIAKLEECSKCIESTERLNQQAEVMTKTLKDSLAKLSDDTKEWQQIKVKLALTAVKGKVILDIGGTRYTTSVETLTREKNTFFTAMFSRQWELERDPKDDSIFIDRDGKLFAHILAYLRTNSISDEIMTHKALREELILEAKYFHLYNLLEILTKLDPAGTLLSLEQHKKLGEFCGNTTLKWELLYQATRDGFDASAFHNRCDNKGPTITVIRSTNNYLFGGYTAAAWTSRDNYAADSKAFLFTLTNPKNFPPTKYPVHPSQTVNAVYHNFGYGPSFGRGHDLHVSSNSNSNNSSYTNFPSTYIDTTGHSTNTFTGSKNFTTSEMEVFKLS